MQAAWLCWLLKSSAVLLAFEESFATCFAMIPLPRSSHRYLFLLYFQVRCYTFGVFSGCSPTLDRSPKSTATAKWLGYESFKIPEYEGHVINFA